MLAGMASGVPRWRVVRKLKWGIGKASGSRAGYNRRPGFYEPHRSQGIPTSGGSRPKDWSGGGTDAGSCKFISNLDVDMLRVGFVATSRSVLF
jgi:hypothetical protein